MREAKHQAELHKWTLLQDPLGRLQSGKDCQLAVANMYFS